jgi:hypothetical protein
MTGVTVTVAVVAMMTVTRAAVVIERVGAMAALAAVVILGSRDSFDCNSAQGTSAYIAPEAASTTRDFPSVFLRTTPEQFCGADADQSARGKVAAVVIIVFLGLFADVHHAVVTAVVIVASAGGLRDRVTRTELSSDAAVIIVIFPDTAMIVVGWFSVSVHF